MAAPTAIVNHGISSGQESRDPVFSYTGPGEFDSLIRYYHAYDSGGDFKVALASVLDIGDSDNDAGGIYLQMYAQSADVVTSSGAWFEVAVRFAGRFNNSADKMTRKMSSNTWSATRENTGYSNILGAWVYTGTWGTDSTGSGTANLEMTGGSIVLEDTYLSNTSPDASSVGSGGSTPGIDPYQITSGELPINPWYAITDETIRWPYGWVLTSRRADHVRGNVSGTVYRYVDTFEFVHKVNP
jgi:hypothetical protein